MGAEIGFPLGNNHNYVILPGWTSTEKENFYPWLADRLRLAGKTATVYKYKSTEENSEEEVVQDLLTNLNLDENTVLIGHSLGAAMALKVLEKIQKPVAKIVLAGGFMTPKFKDKARPFEKNSELEF
ncbi:MAG: alpha/beta hydrolase [Patescibacteria group bacterium]|nr:alpha/beta hydrolase [Patescibacteria group bacterium]